MPFIFVPSCFARSLTRISHRVEAHRGANQRKLLCSNDFSLIQGAHRCRQIVAQNDLILEWWKVGPMMKSTLSRSIRRRVAETPSTGAWLSPELIAILRPPTPPVLLIS